jgi:predicted PurR-regulated permease PerM
MALVLIVAILYLAKMIIVPLALAVLLTFVLTPIVSAIQRRGLGRVPAVLLTVLLTFVLFGIVGWIVGLQVHNLAQELPTHRKEIDAKIVGLRGSGEGAFSDLLQMIREIAKGQTKADTAGEKATLQEKVVVAQPQEPSSFEQLASAVGPVLEPLAQAGLVVILVVFMLVKREDLRNRVIGLLGHGRLAGTTRVLVDAAQRLSRFLLTQLLINVGFGVLFALGLFFVGVPYGFLWGFLAVIFRFVPYIGGLVSVAFPLVLAFAIAPTWTQPILVMALFAVLELLTANVVEPLLFGHGTGVAPIALLIAAAFWTWLWGPIGLVLSTPMTVCLVVLGQHVPRLRVFALLLGDKPALEPPVSYYQRLLARDQAEATQVAAAHAQASGPENVYDDVLLPALALARRDRKQAGLSAADERFIFQATRDILGHLATELQQAAPLREADDHGLAPAETLPPKLPNPEVVLGCPAHHEAEELSLAMLGQLLQRDACRVEAVSTRALPSEVETRVERERPALVFIAILPPGGLVQACYLCKRLRKRFADLPIVVGYWGDERHFDKVLGRVRSAGASYLTTSLLQSTSQIRALVSAFGNKGDCLLESRGQSPLSPNAPRPAPTVGSVPADRKNEPALMGSAAQNNHAERRAQT